MRFSAPNAELRVTIVSQLLPATDTVLGWRVTDVATADTTPDTAYVAYAT